MSKYHTLLKKLNLSFNNQEILENAFIHRSYLNEHKKFHLPSNEKLEFLGDSVLSLVTTIFLYRNYPLLDEGNYTDIKASIVRTESLAEVGKKIELGDYLYLSKGEQLQSGKDNKNILADCFEALIGAIFLDQGFEVTYKFIADHLFKDKLNYIVDNKLYLSPKSRLQEYVQANFKVLPNYKTIKETGPEHQKFFSVATFIKTRQISEGSGNSKKAAEEEAAQNALKKLDMYGKI